MSKPFEGRWKIIYRWHGDTWMVARYSFWLKSDAERYAEQHRYRDAKIIDSALTRPLLTLLNG